MLKRLPGSCFRWVCPRWGPRASGLIQLGLINSLEFRTLLRSSSSALASMRPAYSSGSLLSPTVPKHLQCLYYLLNRSKKAHSDEDTWFQAMIFLCTLMGMSVCMCCVHKSGYMHACVYVYVVLLYVQVSCASLWAHVKVGLRIPVYSSITWEGSFGVDWRIQAGAAPGSAPGGCDQCAWISTNLSVSQIQDRAFARKHVLTFS